MFVLVLFLNSSTGCLVPLLKKVVTLILLLSLNSRIGCLLFEIVVYTSFQLLDWLVVWFHWEGRLSEPAGREQEIYSSELDLYIIPLQITTDKNENTVINTLKDHNCTATQYWETKKRKQQELFNSPQS